MRLAIGSAFLTMAVMLGACATPTPYQPVNSSSSIEGGYSEQRIEPNRYRVTFSGNSMTSRDTVENYLLYRSAELTSQQGYDWFIMADRNVDRDRSVVVDEPFHPGPWGYWGPRWRYRGAGFGWRTWDPWMRDPFWADGMDVSTIEQYEASAEIVMRRGPKPDGELRAFDARQVLADLGPSIQRPA